MIENIETHFLENLIF